MWTSLHGCANRVFPNTTRPAKANRSNLVYRDDLNKMPSTANKSKKHDQDYSASKETLPEIDYKKKLEETSSDVDGSGGDHKDVVRVKVKMTKQEAARLLSKCGEGGRLAFRDVTCELSQVPINRVSVVSHGGGSGYGSALTTIPEEI